MLVIKNIIIVLYFILVSVLYYRSYQKNDKNLLVVVVVLAFCFMAFLFLTWYTQCKNRIAGSLCRHPTICTKYTRKIVQLHKIIEKVRQIEKYNVKYNYRIKERRKVMKYEKYIVIDTETTNSLDDPLCYDIGYVVTDKTGQVYEKHSYLVKEIFFNLDLMKSAYFFEKYDQYISDYRQGKHEIRSFFQIKNKIRQSIRKHKVTKVFAHNAKFDYLSLNTTLRYLTKSRQRFFLPYGIVVWCTLKMARKVFQDQDYTDFCLENDFITDFGKNRYTAEVLYAYLKKQADFCEEHTALEDVLIEKEIAKECFKRSPDINGKLWEEVEDRFYPEKCLVW